MQNKKKEKMERIQGIFNNIDTLCLGFLYFILGNSLSLVALKEGWFLAYVLLECFHNFSYIITIVAHD